MHSVYEESEGEPDLPVTELPYMSLYGSQDHVLFVTRGTDDINQKGSRQVELKVSLEDYPDISNTEGHLNITFYELMTDLEVSDATYT